MGKVKKLKRKIQELEKALAEQRQKKNQHKKALKALKKQQSDKKTVSAKKTLPEKKKKALPEKKKKAATAVKPVENGKPKTVKSTTDDVFSRIRANAKNIDFSRIGKATANEKDDLKRIKGIGPFLEKKLNALGIFTLRQIANFTAEDENKVTEAIEFFRGRIKRDQWVAQSKKLGKEN